jgi:hemoglobin
MSAMNIEDKPPGNPPFETPFAWIGGESQVHALVDRFYDLMDLEPGFAALRAAHGTELANAREKLKMFLTGWMGGPQRYTEQFGHPRLRMRHMPFSIGVLERDLMEWMRNYKTMGVLVLPICFVNKALRVAKMAGIAWDFKASRSSRRARASRLRTRTSPGW